MRTNTKCLLASLVIALVLAAGAGPAAALRSLSLDQRSTRLTSTGLTFTGGSITVICSATLELENERIIPKVIGALWSRNILAGFSRCSGNAEPAGATFLSETGPWHWRYNGILGTLPSITGIKLILLFLHIKIKSTIFGVSVECLYEGNAQGTTVQTGTTITGFRSNEATQIPLSPGQPFGCPSEGAMSGSFTASPSLRTTLI